MSEDGDKPDADLSGLSRLQDRLVLEQLLDHGDDLSRRRHTLLFFYRVEGDSRPAPQIFDRIISESGKLGFAVANQTDRALVVEGHKLVDPENLEALTSWCEGVAAETGADFDGWECAIEPDRPS